MPKPACPPIDAPAPDRATSHDPPPAIDPAVAAALDDAHPVGVCVEPAPPLAAELAPLPAPEVSHPDIRPCPHCGKRCRGSTGLSNHLPACPVSPQPRRHAATTVAPAACCLRCRIELPSPRRLEFHVQAAHGGAAFPPAPGGFTPRTAPSVPAPAQFDAPPASPSPAPAPAPVTRVERRAGPTCGCLGPFERDLADEQGRCLKCSGAYARFVDRRSTSYHATAD